jgi:hypothetical protein
MQYAVDLGHRLGFIEIIARPQDEAIIVDDVNFNCSSDQPRYLQCKSVFNLQLMVNF